MTPARRRTPPRRAPARLSALVAALAVASALTGCVGMPRSGPVVETSAAGSGADGDAINIDPRRPVPGDTPTEIVRGFLDAMQATPAIKTTVAREFLTPEAQAAWAPDQTITYGSASSPRGTAEVTVQLEDADRVDDRGSWTGPLPEAESTLTFPMTRLDGEWRIAAAPDALIVPQSWFEQRFRQVSLYFFDRSGTILVPDPVFVPRGEQFVSTLVNGLLTGPPAELAPFQLNSLPPGLRSVVSVPVSASGVAQVDLTSDTGADVVPAPEEAELLVSQLAWTLRQDPAIDRFGVTIGGRAVQLPTGETEFSVEYGQAYAPYVAGSSTLLYGLLDGRMVAGSAQNLDPVSGPFGISVLGLRTISPDLRADRVAGVSDDGSTLFVGPVRAGSEPLTAPIQLGEDLLDPGWDFSGRLWVVDRRREGAVVHYLQGTQLRTLAVPGISGANVKDFLVSRDGSRLVAVLRRGGSDVIVVSRVLASGDGRVAEALPAVDVTTPEDLGGPVRDIAWRSPTSILLLHPVGRHLFQVRTATVDGAPPGLDALSMTLDRDVLGLAGTPNPGESTYAFARGELVELAGPRAGSLDIDPRVTSLGFVG